MYELFKDSEWVGITYKGKVLTKIRRELVEVKTDEKDQKKTTRRSHINRFVEEYKRQQSLFYGTTTYKKIHPNSKNYKFLKEACELADKHNVSYKDFIKSQVEGLSFANKFPMPNQLSTDGAEQRLLDYMLKEKERNEELKFEDKDKHTPLKENKRYTEIVKRFKESNATYYEVRYLKKCQLARKGEVSRPIKEFLRNAKKDRKDSE